MSMIFDLDLFDKVLTSAAPIGANGSVMTDQSTN